MILYVTTAQTNMVLFCFSDDTQHDAISTATRIIVFYNNFHTLPL